MGEPLIIGHRGACGHRPEHTLASYELAIDLGADWIETDVVPTRDGALICRHENELSGSTDVADQVRFADRQTRKQVDGISMAGWFTEDFTLAELRTLRTREPLAFRDPRYDGAEGLVTPSEIIDLLDRKRRENGRACGLVIEVKHPTYFATLGLNVENSVVNLVEEFSESRASADAPPLIVESFEPTILRSIHRRTGVRIVQLLDARESRPADHLARGDPTTYGDMCSPEGLARIAEYAFAIGAWKRLIVPTRTTAHEMGDRGDEVWLDEPTSLIPDAHSAGLQVHAWTFRDEPRFLSADYGGDPVREYQQFLHLGLDGFITDFPDTARRALRSVL